MRESPALNFSSQLYSIELFETKAKNTYGKYKCFEQISLMLPSGNHLMGFVHLLSREMGGMYSPKFTV